MPIYKPWDTTLNNTDDTQTKSDITAILTEIMQSQKVRTSADGYWDFSTFSNQVAAMSYLKVLGVPRTILDYLLVSLDGQMVVLCGSEKTAYAENYYTINNIARPVMKPIVVNNPRDKIGDLTNPAPIPVFLISACATFRTESAEGLCSNIVTHPHVIYGFNSVFLDVEESSVPDYVVAVRYYLTWGVTNLVDANVAVAQYGIDWGSINVPYALLRFAGEVKIR